MPPPPGDKGSDPGAAVRSGAPSGKNNPVRPPAGEAGGLVRVSSWTISRALSFRSAQDRLASFFAKGGPGQGGGVVSRRPQYPAAGPRQEGDVETPLLDPYEGALEE